MGRHSFLDSILNRPSQSYSEQPSTSSAASGYPKSTGNNGGKGGGKWTAPSDLPNAPRAPSSIMSGSFFGSRKESKSVPTTSRFGRKKRDSVMPGHYDFNNNDGGMSEMGSVADSNATASRRKGRWWEVGSLRGGRSSRAPSIAGDSIFSEPEPPGMGGARTWGMSQQQQRPQYGTFSSAQGMAGIGAGTGQGVMGSGRGRASRSDYGGDASGPANRTRSMRAGTDAPPLPTNSSMARINDVKTGVAPLGNSSPQLLSQVPSAGLKKKSSKQRMSHQSTITTSPTSPAAPSSVASSHSQRRISTGPATGSGGASSEDWKNFVQSMSGSEVAKAWQGLRDAPSMKDAVAKTGTANMQRRKSAVERLQRELEEDAIQEQAMRDPGVIHQDLIARAASQVVGGTPEMDGSAFGLPPSNLRPGSVILPPQDRPLSPMAGGGGGGGDGSKRRSMSPHAVANIHRTWSPPSNASPQLLTRTSLDRDLPTPPGAFRTEELKGEVPGKEQASEGGEEEKEEGDENEEEDDEDDDDEEEEDDDEEDDDDDEDEDETQEQPSLDVVNEEDEESSSSVGHEMHPHSNVAKPTLEGRHRAFEAALRKSGQFRGVSQEATDRAPAIAIEASSPRMPTAEGFKTPEEDGVVPKIAGGVEPASRPDHARPPQPVSEIATTKPVAEDDTTEEEPETPDGNKIGGPLDLDAEARHKAEGKRQEEEEAQENLTETASVRSVDTGRAPTVTFDKTMEGKDANSDKTSKRTPSLRSNSRATLQRRLSDVSLGTSFGMSAIIRNGGRASRSSSSRRVKLGDDDSDSAGDKSDEDVELRARAEAEQQRLRQMKVGDDFFGGSLSSILDKFDKTDWDARSVALTNQLDLNVGAPSSSSSKALQVATDSPAAQETGPTAQDLLSRNAQERISEVRRLRAEEAAKPTAPGAAAAAAAETKTIDSKVSGMAPSFAAVWLLDQKLSPENDQAEVAVGKAVPSVSQRESSLGHGRQASTSSDNSSTVASTGSRLRSFFGGGSSSAAASAAAAAAASSPSSPVMPDSPEKKKTSVLDRPRNRAPKPKEMGGVAISKGKLPAEAPKVKEVEEDTRSTLPGLFSSPKIGTAVPASSSSAAAASDSGSISSPPSSPPTATLPMSKDKPAPAKSALKGVVKPSRSLADTLFSFPGEKKGGDKKAKATKAQSTVPASVSASASLAPSTTRTADATPPSAWGEKRAKKVAKLESKSQAQPIVSEQRQEQAEQQETLSTPKKVEERMAVPVAEAKQEPEQEQERQDKPVEKVGEVSSTKAHEALPAVAPASLQASEAPSVAVDGSSLKDSKRFHTARELADEQGAGQMPTFDSFGTFALPELKNPKAEAKEEVGEADEEEESDSEDEWRAEEEFVDSQEGSEEEDVEQHDDKESAVAHARSPLQPSSEIDSVASTAGPTTPSASEVLERMLPLAARRNDSPGRTTALPESVMAVDKKLPMPPPRSFDGQVEHYHNADDATPLAGPRQEPTYYEDSTPLAETREPTFGMKLIPPTPPALETRNSYVASSRPPSGGAAEPLVEQEQQQESPASMQRSASVRANKLTGPTKSSNLVRSKSSASASSSGAAKRRSAVASAGSEEYKGKGLNLPPGLVATTVAKSDSTVKRKKSKGKGKKVSREDETGELSPTTKAERRHSQSSIRSSSALSSLADAPPVPMIPSTATDGVRALPPHLTTHSETTSSAGDSSPHSRSVSPSPAPSASGRSSAVSSSAASGSVVSDHSSSSYRNSHLAGGGVPHYPRKIRTLSAGPGGQAQTSMMSAISEWESSANSPIDQSRSGATSPVSFTGGHHAAHFPHPHSSASRSASSINVGNTPSFVRNAPLGAPTDAYLHPPGSEGRHTTGHVPSPRSVDGHMWASGANESNASLHQPSRRESYSTASSGLGAPASLASSMPSVPQSSYKPQDPIKSANTIDDRLYARTTMSTVAVTSGAFRSKEGALRGRTLSKSRKASMAELGSANASTSPNGNRSSMDSQSNESMAHQLQEELSKTTMALTSHTPPPRKLNSTSILVQVIAVAIDDIDRLILREKIRSDASAYGFVPGRSFCGRVMEVGWEVKRMRKGDIVFGLQESKKSGALAEFMTVEQDLVAKAPEDCLTIEQIAALPSTGVMAYQIMTNHCSQLPRGARCLILNAHDGVGLLTMQESNGLGLIIVAQCPPSVSDGLAVCEANGAHEVVIGEPLWALNSLHESSFDLVIDTVGGRRIYDGARRILAHGGQFVTCFGDDEHGGVSLIANPTLKAHLRSLRRSFFKKDKKHIGYEWVAMDLVGGDSAECRDALEAVKKAAEEGRVVPRIKSILGFADGPRAFEGVARVGQREEESGAVVVRVS